MSIQSLSHNEVALEYELVYSRRKTIGIYVYPGQRVVVKAPNRVPKREIESFVLSRLDWICAKQEEMAEIPLPTELTFQDKEIHYFLGEPYELRITRHTRNSVFKVKDSLVVGLKNGFDQQEVKKQLTQWYRKQAEQIFMERMQTQFPIFAEVGCIFPNLKVRKMKSRWGSCSYEGEVTLSLELIRFPVHLIDYVIVHEFCHLLEFNHSPRFYQLMETAMPDWKPRKQELEALSRKFGSIH